MKKSRMGHSVLPNTYMQLSSHTAWPDELQVSDPPRGVEVGLDPWVEEAASKRVEVPPPIPSQTVPVAQQPFVTQYSPFGQ